jgi:hypothetical protein
MGSFHKNKKRVLALQKYQQTKKYLIWLKVLVLAFL